MSEIWVRLLEDLRFLIGAMFGLFAIILLGLGIFSPPAVGLNLNLFAGVLTGALAVLMLALAILNVKKVK